MRVLFLDFDGVLHPLGLRLEKCEPGDPSIEVDYFCWLPLLADLLEAHPDVRLVAHTSWRCSHSDERLGAYLGVLQSRYLGATNAALEKLPSIRAWLLVRPEVSAHLILDDADAEFTAGEAQNPTFIACHWQRGLSEPSVQQKITRWLETSHPGNRILAAT